jgi:hypothetical protein
LYRPSELRGLLAAHGLSPERECGEYDGAAFDAARSSRFLVISRREAS